MNYSRTLECVYEKEEEKGGSRVILKVFRSGSGFCFSVSCLLGRLVRAFYPSPESETYRTEREAKAAAVAKIRSWIGKSSKLNKIFCGFEVAYCDQPTLFDGL